MRHRAAFHDMLLLVGRVNAYRQRLEDLKGRARGVHATRGHLTTTWVLRAGSA
jgi:hypothetical protein